MRRLYGSLIRENVCNRSRRRRSYVGVQELMNACGWPNAAGHRPAKCDRRSSTRTRRSIFLITDVPAHQLKAVARHSARPDVARSTEGCDLGFTLSGLPK